VIVRDGLRRMLTEQEDVFFYLTLMNENYPHPAMPEGAEEGILRGVYRLRGDAGAQVRLLGSGTILREVEAAAELLREDFGVESAVYSVTSFTELAREGMDTERWNRLHPRETPRVPYVASALGEGPAVAATDYVRTFAESIRPYVPGRYTVLGTDGYGRSDWRRTLRSFFEVDRHHVAVAALKSLADQGAVAPSVVQDAIDRYELEVEVESPWRR
jgi:pyruvate dehydrogenase E1 component